MDDRSNWMVGGKRVEFGVQVDIRGVDHDSRGVCIRNFHIRMNLYNGNREGGASIYDCVFAEEDDLAGRGEGGHAGQIIYLSYDK